MVGPVKVNETPTNIPVGNQQAFTASVDVADNGTIAVTYYDFRNNTDDPDLLTDYFVVHCQPTRPDRVHGPGNWGTRSASPTSSFDMRQAPLTGTGFFTGDYEGLATAGNDFTRSSLRRTGRIPPASSSAASGRRQRARPRSGGSSARRMRTLSQWPS